jgi:RND family efflux transporter MFP subunit
MRRALLRIVGVVAVCVAGVAGLRLVAPCAPPLALLGPLGLPGDPKACVAASVEDPGPLPPAVTVARATMHDFVDRLFVSGTLVARDEALAGPQEDGLRLVEVLAEDGDHVTKGQVLARLDRSQLDALVAQNDAALLHAEAAISQATSMIGQYDANFAQTSADLDRAKKLGSQIITQSSLDQRLAAFRTAQAALAAGRDALSLAQADKASRLAERRELMVRLDRTEVRAPVAGVVSRRTARLGAMAMASGDALFRIVTDGAIDLEAEIPEQSLARLAVGMQAKIELPGVDGEVEGRVRLISEEVDKATRLGKVRIALPADAARIGSFASGVAIIARRSGVGVPTSAVQRLEKGFYVEVVKDDRVELRPVTTGIANARLTEVRDGLAEGEAVVARAAAFLRSGDIVRPMPTESLAKEASR